MLKENYPSKKVVLVSDVVFIEMEQGRDDDGCPSTAKDHRPPPPSSTETCSKKMIFFFFPLFHVG